MSLQQVNTKESLSEVKIITYNVLSSELATDTFFPETDSKFLQSHYRFQKVIAFLREYIGKNYIVCLQEVSAAWTDNIKLFLENNGYEYHYVAYNDQLGVVIAYPMLLYETITVVEYSVGDNIRDNMQNITFDKEICDAMDSKQRLLIAKVRNITTGKVLNIATYHMPCKFTKQTLMETHVIFCMKLINEFVVDSDGVFEPVIFTGDFNSKYGGNEYSILTRCQLSTTNSQYISYLYPSFCVPFNDSLAFNCNRDYTCYNQTQKETFIIDYIFYRGVVLKGSEVIKTDCFGKNLNTNVHIPSKNFPSDHLPIIGIFTL